MIDWSLGQSSPNFMGLVMQGIEAGRANRAREALSTYVQKPTPEALADLALYAPEQAYSIRNADERNRIALAKEQGDQNAQRQKLAREAIGQAAYRIALLPADQQAQAWDASVGALASQYPEVAQYRGQFSPDVLNATLDATGMSDKVIEARQPKYVVSPPGGGLMNTNPLSPGFNPTAAAPQAQSVEDMAAEAIRNGADPQAVQARLAQLKGGAPSQGGATFP